MTLHLVADDLTGTLDAAAQFCGAIGPVPVLPRLPAIAAVQSGGAAALNLACREDSRDAAVAAASRSAPFLRSGEPAFKKIDSLLRGHWAAELAATLRFGFSSCVLAPAFPAQGRITRDARQFVRSEDGAFVQVGPALADSLAAEGLAIATGSNRKAGGIPPIHVFDASSQEDLHRAAAAGRALAAPVLWCGTAGLAAALAGVEPPQVSQGPLASPVLVLVGTNHPVTRRQVDAALEGRTGAGISLGPHSDISRESVQRALAFGQAVVTVDLPDPCDRSRAARLVAERFADVLPHLAAPGTLVVTGGETLMSVCDALGVESLSVLGEYSPGIPVSRISGGPWSGTIILSKSGAFGSAGLLASILFG